MFRKCLNLNPTQIPISARCISLTSRDLRANAKNHYDVLGLTPKATQNDIKAAYYKLSMMYHPDKNKGSEEAATKFRDITAAYEVLGTFRLRKLYDKGILHTARGAPGAQEAEFKSPTEVRPEDDAQTKFYKSRFKKSQVPDSGAPIYDFDMWSREHYGASLNRNQKAKAKYEKKMSDSGKSKSYNHMEILLFSGLVLAVLIMYANYEESKHDRVSRDKPKTPGKNE
ncbi:dnaJ homolog subfamily C member 30, mitochondrial [Lutzomyia longipalpis]|uniref:dnaJ homolog subfamily C member 30, mitochondrial n=1 Tax=Lutzomyia longipalpis TaxID=7200 RepID=UPI0024845317|nr:dnaJ homolog subfamily C member 30, mitochondrial [Lutzomyia longipalpis]